MRNTIKKSDTDLQETVAVREAVIHNAQGIHCRPTAAIVKRAREFEERIVVESANGHKANPCSAIELLSLGLDRGSHVRIRVEGPQADACADAMVALFETDFDFPPKA